MRSIVTDEVGMSVGHDCETLQNGWTDRDAVCIGGLGWAQGTTY